MNQRPLYDRVIVQRIEEKSTGRIERVGTKEKPMRAKVIAVGGGRLAPEMWWVDSTVDPPARGALIPLLVKPGDTVLIGKYAGVEYEEMDPKTFTTTTYVIIREEDILTIEGEGK